MRRTLSIIMAILAISTPAAATTPDTINSSATAIRDVISGKTCVGEDVLRF